MFSLQTVARLGVAAFVCCLALNSPGRAEICNFQNYGPEQGLTNLGFRRLFQDSKGYLWVSTEGGVFRYDGTRFRHFGVAEGLANDVTASFANAAGGELLLATSHKLYRLVDDRRFVEVPIPGERTIGGYAKLVVNSDGIWVGTSRGLLAGSGNLSEGKINWREIPNPGEAGGLSTRALAPASDGLWYGCGWGLCSLQGARIELFSQRSGLPARSWIYTALDGEGRRWAQSSRGELYVMAPGSKAFSRWAGELPSLTEEGGTIDHSGRLLLNTSQGLAIWSGAGFRVAGRPEGVLGPVYNSLEDREGQLWIAVSGRGLLKWAGYDAWKAYGRDDGLGSDVVYSILPLDATTVLAGTEDGLYEGNLVQGRWRWKSHPAFRHVLIRRLLRSPDGNVLLCGERSGVARYDLKTKRLDWLQPRTPVTSYHEILVDRAGRVWVGTNSGVLVAKSSRDRLVPAQDFPSANTFSLAETADGDIWAATLRGVARISGGHVRFFTRRDGLVSDKVLTVGVQGNQVWIGYLTEGAVTRGHIEGNDFKLEDMGTGRAGTSTITYFLGFDRAGRLWAGTNEGVHVWDGRHWSRYSKEDGLIWDDCNLHGFAEGPDGAIWIGTSAGLALFRSGVKPGPRRTPPKAIFTETTLGGRSVRGETGLTVNYDQNSLQVAYSALTFAREQSLTFKYRLWPAIDWRVTPARELQFPNLPGGEYRFEVLARDGWGGWSEAPAVFEFRVLPPFWWSAGAKSVYACLILLLMGSLFLGRSMWYQRQLEKQRRELEQERIVAQAKAQLERFSHINRVAAVSEMAAVLAHEICQPLSAISCNAATALTILESQPLQLGEAREAVADILDDQRRAYEIIDRMRTGLKPSEFQPRPHDLNELVLQATDFARHYAQANRIDVEMDLASGLPPVLADEIQTQQIVWNLVQNGVDAMSQGGKGRGSLRLRTRSGDGGQVAVIEVEDDGPGISDEHKHRIFEPLFTTKAGGLGMGLAISSSIATMMGGKISVEDGPRGGTLFRVELPVIKDPGALGRSTNRSRVGEAHGPTGRPSPLSSSS